eukprot:12021456-Alexandrium_andersonii.AAC.1
MAALGHLDSSTRTAALLGLSKPLRAPQVALGGFMRPLSRGSTDHLPTPPPQKAPPAQSPGCAFGG